MKQPVVHIVRKRKLNKDIVEEIAVQNFQPSKQDRAKLGLNTKPLSKTGE
jgi:hypothetical protein